MQQKKAGAAVAADKIQLTLYCECKLERNNVPIADLSLRRSAQNKSKILVLQSHVKSASQIQTVAVLNSKTRDTLCQFRASEITQIYAQMAGEGKSTFLVRADGADSVLKVLISAAPPELLQRAIQMLTSAAGPKQPAAGQQKKLEGAKKPTIAAPMGREAARMERKRRLQEVYASGKIAAGFGKAPVAGKRGKTELPTEAEEAKAKPNKPNTNIQAGRITISDLPFDVLCVTLEYLPHLEAWRTCMLSRWFAEVSNLRQTNLSLHNKFLPAEHFIGLLARFNRLKRLSLGRLPALTVSSLKSFPVTLFSLESLDLCEMTSGSDSLFQRIISKTKALKNVRLPYFGQMTARTLECVANCSKAPECFALDSEDATEDWQSGKVSSQAVAIFLRRVAVEKSIELFYMTNEVAAALPKRLEELHFRIPAADLSLQFIADLKSLRTLAICPNVPEIAGASRVRSELSGMLERLGEEDCTIEELEIGGGIVDPDTLGVILAKIGAGLKRLRIHSKLIRDGDVETICEEATGLEELDLAGCILTEDAIEQIEKLLKIKRLVLEMDQFKLYSCRQQLIERFPNVEVVAK